MTLRPHFSTKLQCFSRQELDGVEDLTANNKQYKTFWFAFLYEMTPDINKIKCCQMKRWGFS